MPRLLIFFLFLGITFNALAQTSFSVDTTTVATSSAANTPVFYPWIELTNNTGNLLEMRCVKVLDEKPIAWETYLEDLDSAYTYVPDTSTFFLPAVNQQAQYIIVSFHPNNITGRATVKLKLFPASDPTDTVVLTYLGNAYAATIDTTTAINSSNSDWLPNISLYPQPVTNTLRVNASNLNSVTKLFVVDILGHQLKVKWELVNAENIDVDMHGIEAGTYLIVLQDQAGRSFTKLVTKE